VTLRTVELAEATLAVREWGEPGGRPLLFLHSLGPTASAAVLELAAAPLVERGLRLVAPDQPGFGRSPALPAERYAVPALGALAWELADVLELEQPIVSGHSWGGVVACFIAAQRPEDTRALVLVDSGHVDYRDLPPYARMELTLDERVEQAEAARLRVPDRAALEAELEIATPVAGPASPTSCSRRWSSTREAGSSRRRPGPSVARPCTTSRSPARARRGRRSSERASRRCSSWRRSRRRCES
jgi:pimeloyl-ACP methyl ester carboxylesterase